MDKLDAIYNDYLTNAKTREISLATVKKELQAYSNIVLYGAGSAGIAFYHYLNDSGINISAFSDGDKDKHGLQCEGKEILDPKTIISKFGPNTLVIVTINTDGSSYCKDFKQALLKNGHQGVHKQLHEYGCSHTIDYTYFRRCYHLFDGERYNLPACNDVYLMEKNWNKIKQVYEWLEDETSKETFLKIVEFRMVDDSVKIPTLPEKDMYFEYNLFDKRNDEIFLDCGACTGSSLKDFLRINGNSFKSCISIEPDKNNYDGLLKYISTLENEKQKKIKTVHAGVYAANGIESFYELFGPGTFLSEDGMSKIQTVTIDSILDGEKATYIKMNIEGSEVPALQGAKNTIMQYKPRLAIMGYHKTSDLWNVPFLIKEYCPDYQLFLRSYMHNIAFAYYGC